MLIIFQQGDSCFHFALDPAEYVANPAGKKSSQNLLLPFSTGSFPGSSLCAAERERERQTDRQTETQTETKASLHPWVSGKHESGAPKPRGPQTAHQLLLC